MGRAMTRVMSGDGASNAMTGDLLSAGDASGRWQRRMPPSHSSALGVGPCRSLAALKTGSDVTVRRLRRGGGVCLWCVSRRGGVLVGSASAGQSDHPWTGGPR
jgi:hypothetical protein